MDLQVLTQVDLFKGLDAVNLAHVASIMELREVKRNTVIFTEQDPADTFYIIIKGRVRISKVVPGMGEEALAILNAGSYFGEMEMLEEGMRRSAQATAHEDCVLQVFSYSDFHTLLSTDKDLALAVLWNIVRTLSRRLMDTNDKVAATFALAQFQ